MTLTLYNKVRAVPNEAAKKIEGGRLKNMTDINPMWRIKTLTEQFGPCGIGWYYEITKQWMEQGSNDEVAGFCNINLYVKVGDQWSKPIQGTGGSSFIVKEKAGLYTSDEVYKMALTDAISVACKALGFGADVYWAKDRTKYDLQTEIAQKQQTAPAPQPQNEAPAPKATPAPAPQPQTELSLSELLIDFAKCEDRPALVVAWNKYKGTEFEEQAKTELRKRKEELGIEK